MGSLGKQEAGGPWHEGGKRQALPASASMGSFGQSYLRRGMSCLPMCHGTYQLSTYHGLYMYTPVLCMCVNGGCRRRWGGQSAQSRHRRGPGSIRSAEGDRRPGIPLKRSTAGWSTSPNPKAKSRKRKKEYQTSCSTANSGRRAG